mmetsp:Transcript_6226/g.17367  ORF Transcript_6226/g.17367 Transcript_6226/m.17367 type:complete len:311 (-) Transcript_6226:340-1272(-)
MKSGVQARLVLLATSGITALCALACLVYGGIVLGAATTELRMTVAASPQAVLVIGEVTLAAQMLLSLFGLVGALRKSRSVLLVYLRIAVVLYAILVAIFVYILLAGNGVFSGNTAVLEENVAGKVLTFNLDNPDTWIGFQDTNKCCGFDVRGFYNTSDNGYPGVAPFALEQVFSGKECIGAGIDSANSLKERFPKYNDEAQEDADTTDTLLRTPAFLCFDLIVSSIREFSSGASVALGIILLFQAPALMTTFSLLYSISHENGGLKTEADMTLTDTLGQPSLCERVCGCGPKEQAPSRAVIKFDDPAYMS